MQPCPVAVEQDTSFLDSEHAKSLFCPDAAMQASAVSSTPIISFLPFGPYRSDCQSSDDVQLSRAVESLGIISGLTLSIFFRTHGPVLRSHWL